MWLWGAVLFGAAWLGGLASSVAILRGAKSNIPPKLDGAKG
jgi:hypothetical protein